MNQNDNLEVKPTTEKRIAFSAPIHRVWDWFKDKRIQEIEARQARYFETVQDYVQDQ